MAEETPLFAKKPATKSAKSAESAEKSIFDKPNKDKTATKKPKTSVIIAIVVAALAVIGGVVALVLILVLNQPDYEKMNDALTELSDSGLSADFSGTNFSYLPNGRLSKTTHDRYVKNAKEDLDEVRDYLDAIKETVSDLEKAGAAKSDVSEEYEKFKSQADDLLPKLENAVGDMDKYIDFSDRYYNSKLVVLDSYRSDYSSLKEVSDSDIDEIFQPLKEASSEKLRDFAEKMAKYIKVVANFYNKYSKYLDGSATPTEDTQTELKKDTEEMQNMTKDISKISDISEDDIFDFTQRDLTKFSDSAKKLSSAVKKLL